MQSVILAGGLGTRLRPLTDTRPKSLVPVLGRPFLAYQLEWVARHGLRDVLLCLGHRAEQIQAFAGTGQTFGLRITYVLESDRLLGTAGALRHAEAWLEDEFCLLNGDSYLPVDPRTPIRYFGANGFSAMMLVYHNRGRDDVSNARVEQGWVTGYDRQTLRADMEYIDYGLRMFKKDVLRLIPAGAWCDLDVLYQRLIVAGQLAAYEVQEPFFEIGSTAGLGRFEEYLQHRQPVLT